MFSLFINLGFKKIALKIKPNPDMIFTGQPEALPRLVWDRDFRDSSWLSYKNASGSWEDRS